MPLRVATFNLENLDDGPNVEPTLSDRIRIMRPQLERVRADVLCLQEVHSQEANGAQTFAALEELLSGTAYASFNRESVRTPEGALYDQRNIVTLSRFPIISAEIIRDSSGPRPSYQMATAHPPDTSAEPVNWERPILYTQISLDSG